MWNAREQLNYAVTSAILLTERILIEWSTHEWKSACRVVSVLEEMLAEIHPEASLEGQIARHGSVLAAIRSGDTKRAEALARQWADAGLGDDLLDAEMKRLAECGETPPSERGDGEAFDPKKHCHDCGRAPFWRHADAERGYSNYCRRCYGKNGYRETREIDPDKLDELLGKELADRVLDLCHP